MTLNADVTINSKNIAKLDKYTDNPVTAPEQIKKQYLKNVINDQ